MVGIGNRFGLVPWRHCLLLVRIDRIPGDACLKR